MTGDPSFPTLTADRVAFVMSHPIYKIKREHRREERYYGITFYVNRSLLYVYTEPVSRLPKAYVRDQSFGGGTEDGICCVALNDHLMRSQ